MPRHAACSDPTGSTSVAGVIGSPVGHSRSPAIHNAGFRALGLDWVFVALEVPAGSAAAAVTAMRTLGLRGLSVTMPHKASVIGALDALSPTAQSLGAVNCIAWDADALVGHNTDGAGFVAALQSDGFEVAGARCVVLGAGGAARAVVLALADAGAADVVVSNRHPGRGELAAALAGVVGRSVAPTELTDAVRDASLVVNATPLGMQADDPVPLAPEALHAGLFVSDLIYHPDNTALMRAAVDHGARAVNGLSMLVHQAAIAFEIWTGRAAPLEAMATAASRS